jgi:putative N-acetylmannosamine-6-phosphate epimerase
MKAKTDFEKELQRLRPDDEIQYTQSDKYGYDFIGTASHGYLVVPKNDPNFNIAKKICSYSYKGKLAIYLEEDCEAPEFLKKIGRL